MILQLVLAMVCGALISSRAGAVDEPVAPPRPYGPLPSARQLRWHELQTYAFLHFSVKIVLTFDHVDGEFRPFDVNDPRGFTIAGSDRKFVRAEAKVLGRDKIEVWSDKVSEPVAVRYAWADNPVCNLYSAVGLPTTPFRTADWPGVTINNK